MVTQTVLDASAILAYLQDEDGADQVEASLDGGVIAALTLTEVLGKLMGRGVPAHQAEADLDELELGELLERPVLTAEQGWAGLPNLRTEIRLIRQPRAR